MLMDVVLRIIPELLINVGFKSDDDTEKGFFVFCRDSQRINHDFTVPAGRRRGAVSASVVGGFRRRRHLGTIWPKRSER